MFKITRLEVGGDEIETRTLSDFPVASSETALKLYITVAQSPSKEIPVLLFSSKEQFTLHELAIQKIYCFHSFLHRLMHGNMLEIFL